MPNVVLLRVKVTLNTAPLERSIETITGPTPATTAFIRARLRALLARTVAAFERGRREALVAVGAQGVAYLRTIVPVLDGDLQRAISFQRTGKNGVLWVVTGRPALYYRRVAGASVGRAFPQWARSRGRERIVSTINKAIREANS